MKVTVPGGQLAVSLRAGGPDRAGRLRPPVLLLHGLNSAGSVWSRMVDRLDVDRSTAAVDLRGHGGSTRQGSFGAARQVEDLVAVLDKLQWPRAHVVGSSYGGALGIALAAAVPARVQSVAAIGSALEPSPYVLKLALEVLHKEGVEGFFTAVGPEWTFAPGADPAWIAESHRIAVDNSVDTVARLLEAGFTENFRPAAARVRCPVLVARGEHDRTCTLPTATETAAEFGTEVREIPHAGHLPMVESPAATADLVEKFFASVTREKRYA